MTKTGEIDHRVATASGLVKTGRRFSLQKAVPFLAVLILSLGSNLTWADMGSCPLLLSSELAHDKSPTQAFLAGLDFVLKALAEIDPKVLSASPFATTANQLRTSFLLSLSRQSELIDPLDLLRPSSLNPNQIDLIPHSPALSLLATSGTFSLVQRALSLDDWTELRAALQKMRLDLGDHTDRQDKYREHAAEDFLDLPDNKGRTRLHRLIRAGMYEAAYEMVASPGMTARYLNHRDARRMTPMEYLYTDLGLENSPLPKLTILMAVKGALTNKLLTEVEQHFVGSILELDVQARARASNQFMQRFYENYSEYFSKKRPLFNFSTDTALYIQQFLELGCSLHALEINGHRSAVGQAAYSGNLVFLKYLLDLGADPNFVGKLRKTSLPLEDAIDGDQPGAIETLVQYGVGVNNTIGGQPALVWAVLTEKTLAVKKLIELGADPTGKATTGLDIVQIARTPELIQLAKKALKDWQEKQGLVSPKVSRLTGVRELIRKIRLKVGL